MGRCGPGAGRGPHGCAVRAHVDQVGAPAGAYALWQAGEGGSDDMWAVWAMCMQVPLCACMRACFEELRDTCHASKESTCNLHPICLQLWTPEDMARLEELVAVHGTNWVVGGGEDSVHAVAGCVSGAG